ncbi:MAG: hypothetical protein WBV11_10185 [Salegentibacter sp.]
MTRVIIGQFEVWFWTAERAERTKCLFSAADPVKLMPIAQILGASFLEEKFFLLLL